MTAQGQAKVTLLLELKNRLKEGMAQAKKTVSDNVSAMQQKLNSLKMSGVEALQGIKDRIPGLGNMMGMLGSKIAIVATVVTGLSLAYSKASAMAAEFGQSMSKVNVTAQMSQYQLSAYKQQTLDIAGKSKLSGAVQQAPAALSVLISSGLDKDTALKSLTPTLNAAKVGFVDVAVSARAAASVMNSSGIKDASRVFDVLAMTLNKGNAEFQDIAQYLPKIIPTAKDVGINLEQVAGAFAYLTAQGQTSERASTLLENSFKALSDPEKVKKFKDIGVAIYDQAGKMKPLADIIDSLNIKMNGLSDQGKAKMLDAIGLDMESRGAFSAMAQDASGLRAIIDATTNSTGELARQMDAAKTPMDSWNRIGNLVDKTWVEIGSKVNDTLGRVGDWLVPIAERWLPVIGNLFTWIWETAEAIVKPIFKVVGGLIDWISKSQLIKDLGTAIGKVFEAVYETIKFVSDKISWLYDHTIKPILEGVDWLYKKLSTSGQIEEMLQPIQARMKEIEAQKNEAVNGILMRHREQWIKVANQLAGDNSMAGIVARMVGGTVGGNDLYKPTTNGSGDGGSQSTSIAKVKKANNGSAISGQAQQVKNITFHVNTVGVSGDFISQNADFKNMSRNDLEKFFGDVLKRWVAGMEAGG